MRVRSLLLLIAAGLMRVAAPLAAQPVGEDFRQIRSAQEFKLRTDRAYVLLRMDTSISRFAAALLRVPGAEELAAFDAAKRAAHAKAGAKAGPLESFTSDYRGRPNLFSLFSSRPFAKQGEMAVVLAEVMPGDYVLYGQGVGALLHQCFCLGTVGFSATAGEVTDLGTMLFAFAGKPSDVPELQGEVNLGPSAQMDYHLFAAALRPAAGSATLPAGVDAGKVRPARLRAIGPFLEPGANLVNRLAPVAGVLRYEGGRVIDVASGQEAR